MLFFLLVLVDVIWQRRWADLVLFPRKRRKIPMKEKRYPIGECRTDSANRRVVPGSGWVRFEAIAGAGAGAIGGVVVRRRNMY